MSLINDILDFSKIESGKLELVPVEYQLSSLLNDCYNMVHLQDMEKNLSFVVENNEHLPCTVYGDEVRVRQIVINLLTNAIKYTKQGKISVYLEGEIEEDGRIRLEISVEELVLRTRISVSFSRLSREWMKRKTEMWRVRDLALPLLSSWFSRWMVKSG